MSMFDLLKRNKKEVLTISKFGKFMELTDSMANILSKANNTKVGCMLLNEDRNILSTGYNGGCIGSSSDEKDDIRSKKPEKLFWVVHAETNAICAAAKQGISLKDSICVVNYYPCIDCAKQLIQAGIKKILTKEPSEEYLEKWKESINKSEILFKECGVEVYFIKTINLPFS